MSPDLLFALIAFAFVSSITPGPNNLMLMASGANFGLRRTVPHMTGVTLGFVAMTMLVGLGLIRIFEFWPVTNVILKLASVGFLAWLAWKTANAAPPADGPQIAGSPLTLRKRRSSNGSIQRRGRWR